MKTLHLDIIKVGVYETNCYILKKDGNALIIDPGDEFVKIKNGVGTDKVVGILLTHRHFDHIGALEACKKEYGVSVYEKDTVDETQYQVGPFQFEVLFTPGHTDDSVSYYFKSDDCIFVGDFIFKGTIGRVDLGGNMNDMKNSLKKMIAFSKKHQEEIILYPGHEEFTTLACEIKLNPYFNTL